MQTRAAEPGGETLEAVLSGSSRVSRQVQTYIRAEELFRPCSFPGG